MSRFVGRVSFGPFELNGESRELLRGAERLPVHVTPKAMDLLLLLVAERRRVVRKQELFDGIWPESHVSDATLFSLVDDVRDALGDSGRHPKYVKNEPGIGYRFIAEVHEIPWNEGPITCWLLSKFGEVPLRDGEHIVGRWKPSTVLLPYPNVSREHARIVVKGGEATLTDMESKNKTFLNGRVVDAPQQLADGDEISIGGVKCTFRTIDGTTATAPRFDREKPPQS